ncbi:hypothetical protein C8J57DRAFT_1184994 [Mycena rebaudengoi]|nr:hypothetical protein C8J57DRAFT_1184994 [Mycena rebaudengoi]
MSSYIPTNNLSLYSIPAVWLTAFFPVMMKTATIATVRGFNNVQPRRNTVRVYQDKNVTPEILARIERMEGAHLNGNENLPIWIAAILAGNFAGLDNKILNQASLAYFVGRVLYNFIYINQKTRAQSSIRSLVYAGTLSIPMYLLFKAASKIAQ